MPKKLLEINKFTGGIQSTPSATDINEQVAKYSLNIDPQTALGRLQAIDEDKILTQNDGFQRLDTTLTPYSTNNVRELLTVSDKKNVDAVNLIIGRSMVPATNVINVVSVIQDIYSGSATGATFSGLANDGTGVCFI